MKRDPVGGGWTNLVPSAEPRDLYQEVATWLQVIIDADAAKGDPLAILWKPCIKRGLVKQATMTTPYGVTLSGMKQQLREVILEDEDYRNRFPDEKAAASYLAPKVNRAIGQVVIGAAEVRAWLRKLVKKLARKDRPLSWTVPTGFPVLHEYRAEENKRVPTVRGNVLVKLENPRFKIRTRKQVNSIVPNLIHSLDAAPMMRTVVALKAAGLSDFARQLRGARVRRGPHEQGAARGVRPTPHRVYAGEFLRAGEERLAGRAVHKVGAARARHPRSRGSERCRVFLFMTSSSRAEGSRPFTFAPAYFGSLER